MTGLDADLDSLEALIFLSQRSYLNLQVQVKTFEELGSFICILGSGLSTRLHPRLSIPIFARQPTHADLVVVY